MKLTNQRLLNIMSFFNILQVDGVDDDGKPVVRKLPVKIAFAVRKNRKSVSSHLEDYEESRQELLKEHCKLDKSGELVTEGARKEAKFKSPAAREAFSEKHLELLTTKVDVPIHLVSEPDVEKMQTIEEHVLAGMEFMIDGWGIEEEELADISMNGQAEEED